MELIILGVMALASVIAAVYGFVVYKREANAIKKDEIEVLKAREEMKTYLHNELVALKARVRALEEAKV